LVYGYHCSKRRSRDQTRKIEIFGGHGPAIDVAAVVERFISPVFENFPDIDPRPDYAPEVYVQIHPAMLESVVLNLVHNEVVAAKLSGVNPSADATQMFVSRQFLADGPCVYRRGF
jgi:hypothetical protein